MRGAVEIEYTLACDMGFMKDSQWKYSIQILVAYLWISVQQTGYSTWICSFRW